MPQHIHSSSLNDGVETTTKTVTKTAEAQIREDVVIAASASDAPVDVAFPYQRIKSIKIESTAPMTIKTNSSSSPSQTITFLSPDVIEWNDSSPFTNPITADVTKFYVTSTPGGTLKIRVLFDPTA